MTSRFTMSDLPRSNERMFFSIRMVKYLFCWLLLWQDGAIGSTPFQIRTFLPSFPGSITMMEVFAALLVLTVILERSITRDFTIRRSYFTWPLLLIFFTFFASWLRGCYFKQHVAFVLEFHDIIELPYLFLIMSCAFRDDRDREVLWKLLFAAAIAKAFDGSYIYFYVNDVRKYWGVVQSWRDGYLLGIAVIGFLLLLNYRGESLRRVRNATIWLFPVTALCFMMSFRRTFFVATFICMMAMFVTLPKEKRKRHLVLVLSCLSVFFVTIMLTNPLEVATRLSGITAPQNEGSAFIRLMEWPNVIQNILHHPILGVPVGITWKTYYRMPVSAVYTTLGTHNTYLYFPLRGGIPGAIAFVGLMCKFWKSALLNNRFRKTEEDFLYSQWGIQLLIMYQAACFFGLMYADMVTGILALLLTIFQLQNKHTLGRTSLREVAFWQSMKTGTLVYREPFLRRLYHAFRNPTAKSSGNTVVLVDPA